MTPEAGGLGESAPAGPERCSYCGCILACKANHVKQSLATPQQQKAILDEIRATHGWEGFREIWNQRLEPYGYREGWTLWKKCPGCGASSSNLKPEYTESEAAALAAERSRAAGTEEARREAADWRSEVRRRAERDARTFAELLLARFPEWAPYVRFVGPDEPGDPLQWECALEVRVPCPNPAVDQPLVVRVLGKQVLPCWFGGWHEHIERRDDAEPGDPAHLQWALEVITELVTEKLVPWARYRGEELLSGGARRADEDTPVPGFILLIAQSSTAEREVRRSWRGTYDQVIAAASTEM